MARCLAFIQLHPLLLILHRLQKHLRLLLTHLAFLFRFRFDGLRVLRRFFRLLVAARFYFSGQWLCPPRARAGAPWTLPPPAFPPTRGPGRRASSPLGWS